jgi:hypothetical protein
LQTTAGNEGSYVLTVAEFGPKQGIDHEKGDVSELDEFEARASAKAGRRPGRLDGREDGSGEG